MMKDQYANYVVQKILDTCTDIQRAMLLNRIRTHVHALKKYTYGKHIVARFEQQFGEGISFLGSLILHVFEILYCFTIYCKLDIRRPL